MMFITLFESELQRIIHPPSEVNEKQGIVCGKLFLGEDLVQVQELTTAEDSVKEEVGTWVITATEAEGKAGIPPQEGRGLWLHLTPTTVQAFWRAEVHTAWQPAQVERIRLESDLFSRQRGIFETGLLHGKKVGCVGLGSVGSVLTVELAKSGVDHWVLIDPDRMSVANVARHVCSLRDIGRPKVYAVRDAILERNPTAVILPVVGAIGRELWDAELKAVLADCDLLLVTTDLPCQQRNFFSIAFLANGKFPRSLWEFMKERLEERSFTLSPESRMLATTVS